MSLMSMRRKMASKQTVTIILWILIAVFLVGIVLWSVPGKNMNTPDSKSRGGAVAATVNGEKITLAEIDQAFDDYLMANQATPDLETTLSQRKEIFTKRVNQLVAIQVLRGFDITDIDRETREMATTFAKRVLGDLDQQSEAVAKKLAEDAKTPEEKKNVKTADVIKSEQMAEVIAKAEGKAPKNPTEFAFIKAYVEVLTNPKHGQADNFKQYVQQRLVGREVVKQLPMPLSSPELMKRLFTEDVHARWIFVAAEPATPEGMKAAREKVEKLREEIVKDPSKFAKLAEKESTHTSHLNEGDLGWIQGGSETSADPAMVEYLAYTQKAKELGPVTQVAVRNMATAAFAPMKVDVGYGFLQVIETRKRPKVTDADWQARQEEFTRMQTDRFETSLGNDYMSIMQAQADVKCESLEMRVYLEESRGNYTAASKLTEEALAKQKDQMPRSVMAAFSYRVAMASNDPKVRIANLEVALEYANTQASLLHLMLGDAYERTGDTQKACRQYLNGFIASAAGSTKERTAEMLRPKFKKYQYAEGLQAIEEWEAMEKANQQTPQ